MSLINKKTTALLMVLLFLGITVFLVVRAFNYGIYFDDVYRINNLMTLFYPDAVPYEEQAISSFSAFGVKIPVMYKAYISSFSILPFLPLYFFKDPVVGLRVLNGLYFFVAMVTVFALLIKQNFKNAVTISLMIVLSPLFWRRLLAPYHLILMPLAAWFIYLHFKNGKNRFLFLGFLFIGLSLNIRFYSAWMIAALFLSSILFFPKQWFVTLKSPKKVLLAISGGALGAINYVFYNIQSGFSSVMPFYNKLFNSDNYIEIDYVPTKSLLAEIQERLDLVNVFLGAKYAGTTFLFIFVNLAILLLISLSLYRLIKLKKLRIYKYYFFPIINFLMIAVLILLTPNANRAEHYTFLIPFYELSVIFSIILFCKLYKSPWLKNGFNYLIPIVLIGLNIWNISVRLINDRPPIDKFRSEAIYELNDYINEKGINSEDILHVEWGMYSSLYFLNKGSYTINSIVFDLLTAESYENDYDVIKNKLLERFSFSDEFLYIPMYILSDLDYERTDVDDADLEVSSIEERFKENNINIRNALYALSDEFAEGEGLSAEKIFYDEKMEQDVIVLYRLDNLDGLFFDKDNLKSFVDFSESDYPYIKGAYFYEESFRWSSPESTVFLDYNGEKYLSVDIYIPDINFYKKPELEFSVNIDGIDVGEFLITDSGDHNIKIDVPSDFNFDGAYTTVDLKMDQLLYEKGSDLRNLSFVLSKVGFTD